MACYSISLDLTPIEAESISLRKEAHITAFSDHEAGCDLYAATFTPLVFRPMASFDGENDSLLWRDMRRILTGNFYRISLKFEK